MRHFIILFPTYESHHRAASTNKKYLKPQINIRRMYREYVLNCSLEKKVKCLPKWKFRDIFNTEFNLSFGRLKIDTCQECDRIKVLLDSDISVERHAKLTKIREKHFAINSKIKKNSRMCCCVAEAKNPESKLVVLVFDLQRALEVPSITTSVAFY